MSDFDIIQSSVHDARPAELYEIRYSGQYWYYTSGAETITFSGKTFVPFPIERDEIEPGAASTKSDIAIYLPATAPLALLFRVRPPSELIMLTIYGIDFEDQDAGYEVGWKGRIINGAIEDNKLILTSESVFTSIRRLGLRRRYQVRCPFTIYDNQCGVSRLAYQQSMTVSVVNGVSVVVPATIGYPTGRYTGGFIEWVNNAHGNTESMLIRAYNSTTGLLTLPGYPQGLAAGMDINIYRGCGHILGAGGCADFNNGRRYGGMPYKPGANPFASISLF